MNHASHKKLNQGRIFNGNVSHVCQKSSCKIHALIRITPTC